MKLVVANTMHIAGRSPLRFDPRGRKHKQRLIIWVQSWCEGEHSVWDAEHTADKLPDVRFVCRVSVENQLAFAVGGHGAPRVLSIQNEYPGRADDDMVEIAERGRQVVN